VSGDQWQAVKAAASALALRLAGIEFRHQPYDYEQALVEAPVDHRGALIVLSSPAFAVPNRARIPEFALRHAIPSTFFIREYVQAGGLMSYGASITELYRRAADYVDRVAKGANPADLPIEQPTKFELALNLKTAKARSISGREEHFNLLRELRRMHCARRRTPAQSMLCRHPSSFLLGGQAALGRQLVDGLRQFPAESRKQFLTRHPGLLRQPIDPLLPKPLLELRWRQRFVRPFRHPGIRFVALSVLLELLDQVAQATAQDGACCTAADQSAQQVGETAACGGCT
jgi:ABC transporter substrate binding protein